MRLQYSILPFLLRLAGFFTLVFLLLGVMAAVVGNGIPSLIISLTRSEVVNLDQWELRLYVMDVRTTLSVKTNAQTVLCCQFWSPDGTRIAFTGSRSEPFVWDMRDGTIRPLASSGFIAMIADWSPDSKSVLMGICGRPQQSELQALCRVESDGTDMTFFSITDLEANYSRPKIADWSRDNHWIVFAAGEIYRIAPNRTNLQQLTQFHDFSFGARISPNGKQISFVSRQNDNMELFVMNADGSNLLQLTFTDEDEGIPVWSPDGKHILFQTANQYGTKIDMINIENKEQRQVSDYIPGNTYHPPVWSPDGKYILYEVQMGIGSKLYVMDANGGNIRLLEKDNRLITMNSAWQPQP